MLDNNVFIERINKKSRLIGIDPGGKRIGIAISDENKIVATPYTTLIRENYADLLAKIKKIIESIWHFTKLIDRYLFSCPFIIVTPKSFFKLKILINYNNLFF